MAHKKPKLEQMGRKVFGLPQTDDLAEQTICAIEQLYHSLGLETQLTEYDTDKATAIDMIVQQLEQHGMIQLGENNSIDLAKSRAILNDAIA